MKTQEQKRIEAVERQTRYDAMTDEQKLARAETINPNSRESRRIRERIEEIQAAAEAAEERRVQRELERQAKQRRKNREAA